MSWDPATQIDVLSESECRRARATLDELQPYWVVRKPSIPFYTLGAASYLDAKSGFENYRRTAEQFNPLLKEHFAWLLESVADRLATLLGEQVECSPIMALPGFHIYLSCKLFEKPIASIHFDLQYKNLEWERLNECDFERPLSFTLPVALPETGGGLYTWNIDYEDTRNLDAKAFHEVVERRPRQYHAYSTGKMFIHSGHTLHQAAPGRDLKWTDERITLQGHALKCDSRWQLYW